MIVSQLLILLLPTSKTGCRKFKSMIMSNTSLHKYLLHLSVSLTSAFIILCACSLWVTPSQKWQVDLVAVAGGIVIASSVILFAISAYKKRPPIDRNRNFVVRYGSWLCELFGKYDVNHRNTALVIIITVPLLMGLYLNRWWDQMRFYVIQTTTEPLVCTTPKSFIRCINSNVM